MYCWKCGEDNNDRFTFCVECGSNLRKPLAGDASPVAEASADLGDATTVAPPTFASNISYRQSNERSGRFILIAAVGFVFLVITAIAAMLMWRPSTSDAGQSGIIETGSSTVGKATIDENSSLSNFAKRPSKADEEFAKINAELGRTDVSKQKADIESELHSAEGRFPDDYRFAYQAAKLEAITSKNHHEAFEMLFGAGKKAIEAGKAASLLTDLKKDGSTILKRLTDHKEWTVLEDALRNKDVKALEIK